MQDKYVVLSESDQPATLLNNLTDDAIVKLNLTNFQSFHFIWRNFTPHKALQ